MRYNKKDIRKDVCTVCLLALFVLLMGIPKTLHGDGIVVPYGSSWALPLPPNQLSPEDAPSLNPDNDKKPPFPPNLGSNWENRFLPDGLHNESVPQPTLPITAHSLYQLFLLLIFDF